MAEEQKHSSNVSKCRKRFVGSKSTVLSKRSSAPAQFVNQIPEEILTDPLLNQAIKQLPPNYSFEIHKTIHHVRKNKARMVALQMPEGLQMFVCTIADIIERFTDALTVIMGDVTYGACCIDDYTAVALGCDMLIHYGHSCLVPIDQTSIKTLYVFVEIAIDLTHLVDTVRQNFPSDRVTFYEQLMDSEENGTSIPAGRKIGKTRYLCIQGSPSPNDFPENENAQQRPRTSREPTRLALVSTIQFVSALQKLKEDLVLKYQPDETPSLLSDGKPSRWAGGYEAIIPRSKPLSPGEILGCTAPSLNEVDALLYVGDGRFHLESIMIANPTVPAFRYDPYSKKLTRERYNYDEMRRVRDRAVQSARESITSLPPQDPIQPDPLVELSGPAQHPQLWGVILGTLGRQGSFKQLQAITNQLSTSRVSIPHVPILLSELSPAKLSLFNPYISTFIQTSCPRLSIDWGYAFSRPLLTPYETNVVLGRANGWTIGGTDGGEAKKTAYPMDFYEAGTPWAVSRLKGLF